MRILKFLTTSIILLTVLIVIVVLSMREALLFIAVEKVKSDVRLLRQIQLKGEYTTECVRRGTVAVNQESATTTQLRFTNNQDYLIEVLCNQFSLDPIVVKTESLPPMVSKAAGQGGIVWGEDLSGIRLEIAGREGAVWLDQAQVYSSLTHTEGDLGVQPFTSCVGMGYQCCNSDFMQGMGKQITGVNDCDKTCFEQCLDRPLVLSFASQPFVDPKTRIVNIRSGEQLSFSYTLSSTQQDAFAGRLTEENDNLLFKTMLLLQALIKQENITPEDLPLEVSLSFGDGQVETFSTLQGSANHVYTCSSGSCSYTAQIKATDLKGVSSANSEISKIKVQVSN
ncbi:MAG: hypothetical protein GF390_03355 [Candidatus Pacebacteria bacterium]|nr:hypothetical protein [Candidatus Paceibacterota bacterium]